MITTRKEMDIFHIIEAEIQSLRVTCSDSPGENGALREIREYTSVCSFKTLRNLSACSMYCLGATTKFYSIGNRLFILTAIKLT